MVFSCLQGIIGLASLSSVWLSMHIALGGLAAAALAAHDTVTFGLLELRQASVLQLLLAQDKSVYEIRTLLECSATLTHIT